MKRVPFGKETRLEIISKVCPGCNVPHGQFHNYACPLESCPACGHRLLRCACKVLDIYDSLRTTRGVTDGITDKSEVYRTLNTGSKHLDANYYEEGVLHWIIKDVTARDPKAAKKLEGFMQEMGFRKSGNGYFVTAENLAGHLGVPLDEAREALESLQAEDVCPGWEEQVRNIEH